MRGAAVVHPDGRRFGNSLDLTGEPGRTRAVPVDGVTALPRALDLASVEQFTGALTAYQGAFVVVSHDERFLAEIGVIRRLNLSEGRLADQPIG